jgi:hypothetical protein
MTTEMRKRIAAQNKRIKEMFSSAEISELPPRVLLAILDENRDPKGRLAVVEDRANLARYRAGLKRWETR